MRFAKFALLSYILERDKKNAVLFRVDYSMKIEKGSGSAEVAERGQRAIERSREAPGARQARAAIFAIHPRGSLVPSHPMGY